MKPSRRTALALPVALSAADAAASGTAAFTRARIEADLARYDSFGVKRSGGPGDEAARAWMEGVLASLGFSISNLSVQAPFFEPARQLLQSGATSVAVEPQAIVATTGPGGVSGPLALVADPSQAHLAKDAIAIAVLPFRRHSALVAPFARGPIQACVDAGALAVIAVTTGPTGETIILNAPHAASMFKVPVAVAGPRALEPLMPAIRRGDRASLHLEGATGRRPAVTTIARRPGTGPMLVVSTPRSGWTHCSGERGPGVAIFLALAAWARRRWPARSLLFVSASGHEYDNQGMDAFLRDGAPDVNDVGLWAHLGANIATSDFHDLGPLRPLPSADPQRYLVGHDALLPVLRRSFAGLAGLESPYPTEAGAAGELAHILEKGYRRVFGVFGASRLHHVDTDRLPLATNADIVLAAANGFQRAINALF
jgi:hypothetical protein